FMQALEFPWTF
nr:immunoglobulin light chain junction region [Macaca mulatta]MOX98339.1 immunoglobulin light chain junction region [Macaca mulatta]MOX99403.1 immunoglobulin light chain junction region [Macaca mulatta]MOY04605.1 immunoglobulin light chain junction region [Macaca mulatta]